MQKCDRQTYNRPLVSLGLVLVESTASLKDGLVDASSASNNADGGSALVAESALGSGRKSHTGGSSLSVLGNNGAVVSRGLGALSEVANLGLHVADDSSLRELGKREDVANSNTSLLTSVNELTSMDSLRGNKGGGDLLESVGILELDSADGGTTTLIVKDLSHNTLGVTIALGEVGSLVSDGSLSTTSVGFENRSLTSTASTNDSTHFE
jgi:hypothetical protein